MPSPNLGPLTPNSIPATPEARPQTPDTEGSSIEALGAFNSGAPYQTTERSCTPEGRTFDAERSVSPSSLGSMPPTPPARYCSPSSRLTPNSIPSTPSAGRYSPGTGPYTPEASISGPPSSPASIPPTPAARYFSPTPELDGPSSRAPTPVARYFSPSPELDGQYSRAPTPSAGSYSPRRRSSIPALEVSRSSSPSTLGSMPPTPRAGDLDSRFLSPAVRLNTPDAWPKTPVSPSPQHPLRLTPAAEDPTLSISREASGGGPSTPARR